MNALKVFKNFFFTLLNIKLISNDSCPPVEEIEPCICFADHINEVSIYCVGHEINDKTIIPVIENINKYLLLNPQTLLKLFRIERTSITSMDNQVFEIMPFIQIEIYDNQLLDLGTFSETKLFASFNTMKSFYASNNGLMNSDGNQLVSLFSGLPALQYLTIKEHKIKKISKNSFSNEDQYSLRFVDLSNNQISSIGDNAFYGLLNLVYLNLGNNNLKALSANSLSIKSWSSIPLHLILENNELTSNALNEMSFRRIKRPLILFIQNNRLNYFPESVFRPIIEDERNYLIEVSGNPFVCDCQRHKWVFQLGKHQRVKLRNLYCDQSIIWDYESEAIRNCLF